MKNKLLLLAMGIALSAQILHAQVPSYVSTNGLIGYWPFNGNANDLSGNGNNGTVNGATLTSDRFGNFNSSYSFDGVNDFIEIPTINFSNYTISSWVNLDSFATTSTGGLSGIFSTLMGPFYTGVELRVDGTGFITNLLGGNSSWYSATNSNSLQLNTWVNVTVSWDGSVSKIYKNGILVETLNAPYFTNNNFPIMIGTRGNYSNGGWLDGKIDDIGLWNRALTQQEITAMYNGVTYSATCNNVSGSLTQGLVGYWPFCGNANDDSGNGNNGTVNGATLTTDRFGNANSAYSFDGINSSVDCGNIPNALWGSSNNFSFNFWFKPDGIRYGRVFTYWPNSGDLSFAIQCTYEQNRIAFNCSQYTAMANAPYAQIYPNFTFSNNTWYNITLTYSSNEIKMYVNGSFIDSTNYNGPIANHGLNSILRFGIHPIETSERFSGILDDFSCFNKLLSQTEITNLYNQNQCFTNTTVTDTLIINVGQLSYTNPVTYSNNITIAPNPASTEININFNNITNLAGGSINIINSLGQSVATTPITATGTQTTMQLSVWGGTGLYFVQIINAQGQIVDIKKIILQ